MKQRLLLIAAAWLALISIPTAVRAQLPDGISEAMVTEGETLYKGLGLCFACHGPTGTGVPGAGVNLSDDEWLHSDGSFEGLIEQILDGVGPDISKSGVIMLPKGGSQVTDEQVRAIAAYVWTLRLQQEAT
jgi:mono/diheme cytochrome c family protein